MSVRVHKNAKKMVVQAEKILLVELTPWKMKHDCLSVYILFNATDEREDFLPGLNWGSFDYKSNALPLRQASL